MLKEGKIKLKNPGEIEIMAEGGAMLARVKHALFENVKEGVSAWNIEELAVDLIEKEGAEASFKKVDNYHWATCVNVNSGIVHGIPKKTLVFKKGDIVSVDVGVFFRGFHTDTSFTKGLNVDTFSEKFINTGEDALRKAISQARVENRIFDISNATESVLKGAGLTPVKALVGHGVGRELHEPPQIYCYVHGKREESPVIQEGAVLAIEVMYTTGTGELALEEDGWTISTLDDTISGLFEDTVAVTKKGPIILTD